MKKYSFFKKCYLSVVSPVFYVDMAKERLRKGIGFLILVILIVGSLSGLYTGLQSKASISYIAEQLEGPDFPDFTFSDGILDVDIEEPYVFTDENTYIVIVDMGTTYSISDLRSYDLGYLINSKEIIIRSKDGNPTSMTYENFSFYNLNKASAATLIRNFSKYIPIIFILFTIVILLFVSIFRIAVIYIISLFLTRKYAIQELKGKPLLNMVLYAMALPTLLFELFINVPFLMNISNALSFSVFSMQYLVYIIPASYLMNRAIKACKAADEDDDSIDKDSTITKNDSANTNQKDLEH